MKPSQAERLRSLFRPPEAPRVEESLPLPPLAHTPGGHLLRALDGGRGEVLEIRDPDGQLELRVRLTEDGPVVEIDAVKLEVKAAQTIALDCERFSVEAREAVELRSGRDLALRGQGDVHVDGDNLLLNCGDRPAGPQRCP